ncbi:MAG: hypothetical protein HND44_00900 [Chloroflexi bacterium]|nr:hypothetical protein [Ardenticatenaceae bacterium]MBL1127058.1 hypothetical protein [Chloroflexota bacterium]NOG33119.1 hypothetical protein [Chloroflexota bacterium]GIK54582.1 MAG: hypothetical protein BroJett015_02450 [Chloroflexota bacterium]
MSTIQYCHPDDIMLEKREDGHLLNPRHRTGDTTDLTLSAQAANGRLIVPLLLYRNEAGQLVAGDGQRRIAAARKLGIQVPYIEIEAQPTNGAVSEGGLDSLDIMLVSNVRQEFPPLVLDREGHIVGGLAYAVRTKTRQGKSTMAIARLMGMKTDRSVKLLLSLFEAPLNVRQAIAAGRMSLHAYEGIRHAAQAEQAEVVAVIEAKAEADEEIQITRDKVRRAARNVQASRQPTLVTNDEPTIVQQLNEIKARLEAILTAGPLGLREQYVVEQIKEMLT